MSINYCDNCGNQLMIIDITVKSYHTTLQVITLLYVIINSNNITLRQQYKVFSCACVFFAQTAGFNLVPSPLIVAVEQGTATFQCRHSLSDVIGWQVNGMTLNAANLAGIPATSNSQFYDDVTTHTLSIGTSLEYDGTTVKCIATFINGSPPQFTSPVALQIQGS